MAIEQNVNPIGAEVQPDPADVSKNKVFAILSYFGILFILPLICCKDSAYAKFHANQGLLIFLMEIVVGIVAGVIGAIIPLLGGILSLVISILVFVFFILGLVSAVKGTMKPLPLIGGIKIIK